MITLSTFRELGQGAEIPVLPAVTERIRTQLIEFPVQTDGLSAVRMPVADMPLPRFSVFKFESAVLHGFRLFGLDGRWFTDSSLVDTIGREPGLFAKKMAIGQTEDLVFDGDAVASRSGQIRDLDGTDTLVLSSDEPSNFGSWIYRFLPKFALSHEATGIKKVFAYNADAWMLPILRLVSPDVEIVPHWPHVSYRVRNAMVPSHPAPLVYFRTEVRAALDRIIETCPRAPKGFERIYVSRRKQAIQRPQLRVFENETELVERLIPLGFKEVFPETHPIDEQIAIFASAKVIVSPGGSNLFCAAFARAADLIVDIESCPTWLYAHVNLLASSLRPYSVAMGVQSPRGTGSHRNWSADVDALIRGLQKLGV